MHQPVSKGPGVTLGVGQYFTRNETWAEQAKPWIDYLSRASFLLQQGRAANDIAVFYGEAGPIVAPYRDSLPAVPDGYRYDYVNADVILNKLTVRDGAMTTDTGMRYGALFIGHGAERISLPVLRKMRDMVREGAVLIGPKPQGSPSLADSPEEVKSIINALWPGGTAATVGKGRVFADDDTAAALQAIKLAPDFTHAKPNADNRVMFIHRRLSDGDVYFLSNRLDRSGTIEASFRVSGRPRRFTTQTQALERVQIEDICVGLDSVQKQGMCYSTEATVSRQVAGVIQRAHGSLESFQLIIEIRREEERLRAFGGF